MHSQRLEQIAAAIAVFSVLALLFLPLFLIHGYETEEVVRGVGHLGEVTVGLAVILRATARRVLTTAASSILRTSFATFSRAAARTVMRRFIRFFLRTLFGVIARDIAAAPAQLSKTGDEQANREQRSPFIPLALGAVSLCLSFAGILLVVTPAQRYDITHGSLTTLVLVSLLAGLPLLVYSLLTWWAARLHGVSIRFNTAFDGLLLQGYFTGAGSFLPMTTDIEYEGSGPARMRVAAMALLGMYAIHLLLYLLAAWSGFYLLDFAAGMFVIYCFVYSFPIHPLEGYDIWTENKWLWLAVWLPILLSFIYNVSPALLHVL
ncbi:MAG: hypothetical protein GY731_00580 [Gammaproteobacteria bacterium]|nr:hypothetical protein [Gammaproteobacteria bacterium]